MRLVADSFAACLSKMDTLGDEGILPLDERREVEKDADECALKVESGTNLCDCFTSSAFSVECNECCKFLGKEVEGSGDFITAIGGLSCFKGDNDFEGEERGAFMPETP